MSTDLDVREFFRTDSMALVSFLKMEDHSVQDVRWHGRQCYWYFRNTDELAVAVSQYLGGSSLVEPKTYNHTLRLTRQEFYDSDPRPRLPYQPRPRRRT